MSETEDIEDDEDESEFDDLAEVQESIAELMHKAISFLDGHEFTDPKAAKAAAILQGEFQFALRHWFEPVEGDDEDEEADLEDEDDEDEDDEDADDDADEDKA